jgi:hypothetical protein
MRFVPSSVGRNCWRVDSGVKTTSAGRVASVGRVQFWGRRRERDTGTPLCYTPES